MAGDTQDHPGDHTEDQAGEDEKWLVIDGRRWRRTDPSLPDDVVTALTSHLGRARAAVRVAKQSGESAAISAARERVNLAKHGLGERGPYWWDEPEDARTDRAREAITRLDQLDPPRAD